MNRLPGRDALEAELDTAQSAAPLEPKVATWDRRRSPEVSKPPATLRERLRALFDRR
jgi:hypothetical protein